MAREIFETKRKALKINLNPEIYGTFAEIGAGQEVARNFFNAGAASGTIAKTCRLTTWLSVMRFMVKRLMVVTSAEHV